MPRAWYSADRTRGIAKRLGSFCLGIFVLWFLSGIPFFSGVVQTVEGVVYHTGSFLGRTTARVFANEDSLSVQLNTCTERLGNAVARAASLEGKARENIEWRAIVKYEARTGSSGVSARIIARDTPEQSTVTIDRGANDGVRVGAATIIGDGVLFGVVHAVKDTSATVRLTEHPQSAIPVAIFGSATTIGLVSGKEGASLSMEYIPQDSGLAVGDIVVTSGLDGAIAQGIVLGTVTDVSTTPSAPFLTAIIRPVHDSRAWTAVMVLPYPEDTL